VILEHIKYMVKVLNAKAIFEPDFKYFYFKIDEPTYIKLIKLDILTALAS
jgi:AP-4 complex subunit beta-1